MRRCLVPVLGLLLAACGPLVMIPGGELSGEESSLPPDWSFTDSIDTVQLETRPDDPYSVNVWGVAAGAVFYVAAGDSASTWATNLRADPRVRLKVGDRLYSLEAVATDDPAEVEVFLAALKRKYDFEPDEAQRESSQLFRLE